MKKFYQCLAAGEEYSDDAWRLWQTKHPSQLQDGPPQGSSQAQEGAYGYGRGGRGGSRGGGGGGAGRGNCFKCAVHPLSAPFHANCFMITATVSSACAKADADIWYEGCQLWPGTCRGAACKQIFFLALSRRSCNLKFGIQLQLSNFADAGAVNLGTGHRIARADPAAAAPHLRHLTAAPSPLVRGRPMPGARALAPAAAAPALAGAGRVQAAELRRTLR